MDQNYKNHSRLVTGYHGILALLIVSGLTGSIFNLIGSMNNESFYSASLITLLFVCCILLFWYTRSFPLKAQDRAIRSEENFRHYIVTGKPFPSELKMGQIIALRFASDEEFPKLVQRAITEKMDPKSIKLAIQNWKPDYHRV
jgi:Na+/melibiose symporter-like transporter